MTRKEWLETFLTLADRNAPAMQYRRKLGIRAQKLPTFVRQIGSFRKELEKLHAEDIYAANRKKKEESLKKARRMIKEKRERERQFERDRLAELQAAAAASDAASDAASGDTATNDASSDEEAVGPRDDSGDEPDVHG